ncbi:MAG TPA: hypothetical protein VF844_16845 [Ktedonobacteraceae bacterium]
MMIGEDMQQHPRDQRSRSVRGRRTQPALPGVTLPTSPIVMQSQRNHALPLSPVIKKRPQHAKQAAFKLVGLGFLLALLYLAMYPLLAGAVAGNGLAKQALFGMFPWLPHLFWTSWASILVQGLHHIPVFNLSSGTTVGNAHANLLLALFILAFVVILFAARTGGKVARERLSPKDRSLLFWTVFILTGIFGAIFFFAPGMMSQDVFLYGTYGRMVTVYHVNPYVVNPAAYPADLLHTLLSTKAIGVAHFGPLWIDMTLPVVAGARESVANIMVGFRLVGLVAYLTDTLLIWAILARFKPELRISGTLMFAWNPLVLLVGVSEMHYEMVVLLLLLLGALFCQRRSFLIGWVCMLLATLFNMFCLLLLPLFLKLLWKESRAMRGGRRFLWWLALTGLSGAVVVLAFTPYWPGWGLTGFVSNLQQTFLQDSAMNSLDAAILHLPTGFPPFLSWIAVPQRWTILAAVTVGSLLVFGLWLVDTLEMVLLFSSWIFLALAVLLPVHWPWFMLLPLALAIVSASRRTTLLALLLTMGAALEYYFLLWPKVWSDIALVTIGVPLLVWGWALFFIATWHMTRPEDTEQPSPRSIKGFSFARPSLPSRPSRPDRRKPL